MNLTIFSKHFWPENFKINDVAIKLNKKINVRVFTSQPNYNLKFKRKYLKEKYFSGMKVNYFHSYYKKKNNFLNITIDYIFYIIYSTFKINFFMKEKSDVVLTFATSPLFQSIPAIYFAKMKKIPSVLWVQDLWPEVLEDTGYIKNKFFINFINYFVKKIYYNSDIILAQSDSFKKHLKRKYKIDKKIITLHQPSEFSFQDSSISKKKYTKIIYAGNFGNAQNFDTLIEAFKSGKINKKTKFFLIGNGKKINEIKKKINLNNLNNFIKIKSYMNKNNLMKEFNSCSAFFIGLNDGKSLNKTIPGKFQTYLSFGKPIIICSNSFLNNIIKKNNIGFTSKINDIKSLVKNINRISVLKQSQKKKIYFSSKKLYEQNFEIDNIVNKLIKILYIAKRDYVKKILL